MAAQPASFTSVPRTATVRDPVARGWSLHRALVVAGFASVLLADVIYNASNLGAMVGPEALPLLPGIIGIALLLQRETPRRLLAAALTVAIMPLLVLLAFGAIGEVANPLTGTTYLAIMLLIASLALALPSGIQGWRARRGPALPRARGGTHTRLGLFAALATALLLGLGLAGALAGGHASQSGAGGYDFAPAAAVAVKVEGFAFPAAPTPLAAGAVTEVAVTNKDSAFHTFTYAVGGHTFSHPLPGGASVKFLVKLDAPGSIQYWCEPHSSASNGARSGMVGSFEVA